MNDHQHGHYQQGGYDDRDDGRDRRDEVSFTVLLLLCIPVQSFSTGEIRTEMSRAKQVASAEARVRIKPQGTRSNSQGFDLPQSVTHQTMLGDQSERRTGIARSLAPKNRPRGRGVLWPPFTSATLCTG
jgi:hypothetical protein